MLCILCAAFVCRLSSAGAEPLRVAVIHGTYDNNRHQGEHDGALAELGWPATQYPMTDLKRLAGELGGYDLVLGNPLFNFGDVQDYGAHAGAWRAFLERGGALVLTDCNYAPCVEWLKKVDAGLEAGTEACKAPAPAAESTPRHPLHFLPNAIEAHNSWAHLVLPGKGWEVLSRCGDGHPVAAAARLGKGLLLITSGWPLRAADLENVRANLALHRLGFAATRFEMPRLTVGQGELRLGLKRTAGAPATAGLSLEAGPEGGAPARFAQSASFTAGQEHLLRLPYRLSTRGKTRVRLRLDLGPEAADLLSRESVLPDLLSLRLRAPVYRGLVPLSRWSGKVVAGVEVVPDREKTGRLSLAAEVLDAAGKQVCRRDLKRLPGADFAVALETGRVPPGDYSIRAVLAEGKKVLANASAPFTVLEDLPAQVVIDDDLNTVVNGKPFFPIALYHVSDEDLPKVAALGMNSVQAWGGKVERARRTLDAARKSGLMVLLEMGGLVLPKVDRTGIEEHVRALKEHPALLVWYVRDEPSPADHATVAEANDLFHSLDRNHPTYMVSCIPQEFGRQAALADILAVDPYPMPHAPAAMVAHWADLAWQATKGEKPVWLIPQLHDSTSYQAKPPARGANPPTPTQLRCMTYLSLVHGARGLVWYPWDDGPNMGAKYHPPLQEELKRLCGEIGALSPALLSRERRQFAVAEGKVHGMLCGAGPERALLLVNATAEALSATLDLPEAKPGAVLRQGFDEGTLPLAGRRATLELKPYEVRVYRW